jgi:hypothetical protein
VGPSSDPGTAADGAVGDADVEDRSGSREHPANKVKVQSRSVRQRDMRTLRELMTDNWQAQASIRFGPQS